MCRGRLTELGNCLGKAEGEGQGGGPVAPKLVLGLLTGWGAVAAGRAPRYLVRRQPRENRDLSMPQLLPV